MEENSLTPVRLTKDQLKAAVDVLADAFRDYPMLSRYYSDKFRREKMTLGFLAVSVYSGYRYGEVYATSPNLEGIAVWFPPGCYPVSIWELLRSVPLSVLFGFVRYGGARMRQIGKYIDSTHFRLAPFPHWYLQALGVAPAHQGKGFSSFLLRDMFKRIEREGMPCYLETFDRENVAIYEHLGFRVVEQSAIPGTGLTNWAMLRDRSG